MFQREWAKNSIEQLLDMLRSMDEELDRRIEKSRKSDPSDRTSPAERNQEIVELGMILHELKQYIAKQRSTELANLLEPLTEVERANALLEAARYFKRKDYYKVIGRCNYVLEHEPNNIQAHFLRGLALTRADMYHEAIKSFSSVIASNPEMLEAYRERAKAYTMLENWESLIADQSEILRLASDDFTIYRERGMTYLTLGEKEKAIIDFDACLALNHKDFTAYLFRSKAYLKLGNLNRALEDAKSADRWTNDDLAKRLAREIENQMNSQTPQKAKEGWFESFFGSIRKFMGDE